MGPPPLPPFAGSGSSARAAGQARISASIAKVDGASALMGRPLGMVAASFSPPLCGCQYAERISSLAMCSAGSYHQAGEGNSNKHSSGRPRITSGSRTAHPHPLPLSRLRERGAIPGPPPVAESGAFPCDVALSPAQGLLVLLPLLLGAAAPKPPAPPKAQPAAANDLSTERLRADGHHGRDSGDLR